MIRIIQVVRSGSTFGPKGDAQMDITYVVEGHPIELTKSAYALAREAYLRSTLHEEHERKGFDPIVDYYGRERDGVWQFYAKYAPRFGSDPTTLTLLTLEQVEASLAAFGEYIEAAIPTAQLYLRIEGLVTAAGLEYHGTSPTANGGYNVAVSVANADLGMVNAEGEDVSIDNSVWGTKYGLTWKDDIPRGMDEAHITLVSDDDVVNLPEYCKIVRTAHVAKCIAFLETAVLNKEARLLLTKAQYNFKPHLTKFECAGSGSQRRMVFQVKELTYALALPQSDGLDKCLGVLTNLIGTEEGLATLASSLGVMYVAPVVESEEVIKEREKAMEERMRLAALAKNRAESKAKKDLANAWTALGTAARVKYAKGDK